MAQTAAHLVDHVIPHVPGAPVVGEVPAPTDEALQAVLHKIITRLMQLLTRRGMLIEEQSQTYMADDKGDSAEARALRKLRAAAVSQSVSLDLRKRLTVHFAPLRGAHSAEMAKTPNPTNLIRLIPAEEEPICSPWWRSWREALT